MLLKRTSKKKIYFSFKMAERRKNLRDKIIEEMILIACLLKNYYGTWYSMIRKEKGWSEEGMNQWKKRVFIVVIIFSASDNNVSALNIFLLLE